MKLTELLQGVSVREIHADPSMEIGGVSHDSRLTAPGDLFVAMRGMETDGHRFIGKAVERGAVCVLCEEPSEGEIPWVRVDNARRSLAVLGANWFDHPADRMRMVGVTGTNGKTTSTYLLKAVLESRGEKVGLIGTNQNMIGSQVVETERTTPESFALQGLLRQMADAGCTHVVMEVSSHALVLDRVFGIHYAVAGFTNLTQDHLDFHVTMEDYCAAKAILFRRCDTGVFNVDDPWAQRLMEGASCRRLTVGERSGDLRAEEIRLEGDRVSFTACMGEERVPVTVGIPGGFTVYNTLGVMGMALALGIPLAESAKALARAGAVKGRVEPVPTDGDYAILIDYAHTPDAMENVLTSARGFARGRVVALFGCGGDRDRTKRPKMGRIGAECSDFAIITSDNPRTEDPLAIIQDILPGLEGTTAPHVVIPDRVEAIHYAIDHAQPGDVIVLCGKGHETYQEINHVKHHMDEREIVAEYLEKRKKD